MRLIFFHRVLCGRSLAMHHLNSSLSRNMMFSTTACQNVTLKVVPAPPADNLGHDERNAKLKRELSPHLTIYKPQLTSMLSITHRFSGKECNGLSSYLSKLI